MVAFVTLFHVPATQGTQAAGDVDPGFGFAVPRGHTVQLLAPVSLTV